MPRAKPFPSRSLAMPSPQNLTRRCCSGMKGSPNDLSMITSREMSSVHRHQTLVHSTITLVARIPCRRKKTISHTLRIERARDATSPQLTTKQIDRVDGRATGGETIPTVTTKPVADQIPSRTLDLMAVALACRHLDIGLPGRRPMRIVLSGLEAVTTLHGIPAP